MGSIKRSWVSLVLMLFSGFAALSVFFFLPAIYTHGQNPTSGVLEIVSLTPNPADASLTVQGSGYGGKSISTDGTCPNGSFYERDSALPLQGGNGYSIDNGPRQAYTLTQTQAGNTVITCSGQQEYKDYLYSFSVSNINTANLANGTHTITFYAVSSTGGSDIFVSGNFSVQHAGSGIGIHSQITGLSATLNADQSNLSVLANGSTGCFNPCASKDDNVDINSSYNISGPRTYTGTTKYFPSKGPSLWYYLGSDIPDTVDVSTWPNGTYTLDFYIIEGASGIPDRGSATASRAVSFTINRPSSDFSFTCGGTVTLHSVNDAGAFSMVVSKQGNFSQDISFSYSLTPVNQAPTANDPVLSPSPPNKLVLSSPNYAGAFSIVRTSAMTSGTYNLSFIATSSGFATKPACTATLVLDGLPQIQIYNPSDNTDTVKGNNFASASYVIKNIGEASTSPVQDTFLTPWITSIRTFFTTLAPGQSYTAGTVTFNPKGAKIGDNISTGSGIVEAQCTNNCKVPTSVFLQARYHVDGPTVSISPSSVNVAPGATVNVVVSATNVNTTAPVVSANWNLPCGQPTASQLTSPGGYACAFPAPSSSRSYTAQVKGLPDNDTTSANFASANFSVNVSASVPTLSLWSDSSFVSYNGSTNIHWTSTNTSSCTISNNKNATQWTTSADAPGNQATGSLTSTITYSGSCTGPGGTASAVVTVNVYKPTASITAANGNIANNAATTISWTSSDVVLNSCSIQKNGTATGWSGDSGSNTTGALSGPGTFTYSITCTGLDNTIVTASTSVTVSALANYSMSVSPQGVWEVSAAKGSASPQQTYRVTNTGNKTYSVSVFKAFNSSWLSLNPSSCILNPGNFCDVTLTLNTSTAGAFGEYVDFDNSFVQAERRTVSYTVSATYDFSVTPNPVNFTAQKNSGSPNSLITLKNSGNQTLNVTATARNASTGGTVWVSLPNPGAMPPAGEIGSQINMSLTFNTTIPGGTYTGFIDFADASSGTFLKSLQINYTVNPPTCPAGSITAPSSVDVTKTGNVTVSSGFTGGSFYSNNLGVLSTNGTSTVTGVEGGVTSLSSNSNWNHSSGATACKLSDSANVTVKDFTLSASTIYPTTGATSIRANTTDTATIRVNINSVNGGDMTPVTVLAPTMPTGWSINNTFAQGTPGGNVTFIITPPSSTASRVTQTFTFTGDYNGHNAHTASTDVVLDPPTTCPAGSVVLSSPNEDVTSSSVTVSAPSGFSGGTFYSSNNAIATIINGNSIKAMEVGIVNISGNGDWSYSNGAKNCTLSAKAITVKDFGISAVANPSTFTQGNSGGVYANNSVLTVTVESQNGGTMPVSVQVPTMPSGWTINPPFSQTVNAGGQVSFTITASPGAYSGQQVLFIQGTYNSHSHSGSVSVSALAANRAFSINPTSLSFYAQKNQSPTAGPQNVTVTNSGNQNLNISATISYVGSETGWLNITNPGALVPNQSNTSTVSANPVKTSGTYTAFINYSDNVGSSKNIEVTYNVANPPCNVSLSPSSLTLDIGGTASLSGIHFDANSPTVWSADPTELQIIASSPTAVTVKALKGRQGQSATLTASSVSGNNGSTGCATSASITIKDFSVSLNGQQVYDVTQGSTASFSVSLTSINGFNQNVSLAQSGAPTTPGPVSFSSNNLAVPYNSTLLIPTSTNTNPGAYPVNISGSYAGFSRSAPVATLNVNSYAYSVTPSSLNFSATVNGFLPGAQNADVYNQGNQINTFSASIVSITGGNWLVLPGNFSVNPGQHAFPSFSVNTTNLSPGSYSATVRFTPSQGQTKDITVNYTINNAYNFALNLGPTNQEVTVGSSASFVVTVSCSGGFSGTVASFTVNNLQTGAVPSFSPTTVACGSTTTLVINTSSSATGTKTITVSGLGSGGLGQRTSNGRDLSIYPQATVTLNASPASQASRYLPFKFAFAGGNLNVPNNTPVNLSWNGQNTQAGNPCIADSGDWSTAGVAQGTSLPAISNRDTQPLGGGVYTYQVYCKNELNAQGPSDIFIVTVGSGGDFDLQVNPASIILGQGGSYSAQVYAINCTNGFNGPVTDMRVSGLPAGVTANFVTQPIGGNSSDTSKIASCGSGNFIYMELQASDSASLGNYSLTVSGDGPSGTRNAILGLDVQQSLANLSASDKDIINVPNGATSACSGITNSDVIPFMPKTGTVLTFQINICNSGDKDAYVKQVTDYFTNLAKYQNSWQAVYNDSSGSTPIPDSSIGVATSPSTGQLILTFDFSAQNKVIPKRTQVNGSNQYGIGSITFKAQVKPVDGDLISCDCYHFQNKASIVESNNNTTNVTTPFFLASHKQAPFLQEVAP